MTIQPTEKVDSERDTHKWRSKRDRRWRDVICRCGCLWMSALCDLGGTQEGPKKKCTAVKGPPSQSPVHPFVRLCLHVHPNCAGDDLEDAADCQEVAVLGSGATGSLGRCPRWPHGQSYSTILRTVPCSTDHQLCARSWTLGSISRRARALTQRGRRTSSSRPKECRL